MSRRRGFQGLVGALVLAGGLGGVVHGGGKGVTNDFIPAAVFFDNGSDMAITGPDLIDSGAQLTANCQGLRVQIAAGELVVSCGEGTLMVEVPEPTEADPNEVRIVESDPLYGISTSQVSHPNDYGQYLDYPPITKLYDMNTGSGSEICVEMGFWLGNADVRFRRNPPEITTLPGFDADDIYHEGSTFARVTCQEVNNDPRCVTWEIVPYGCDETRHLSGTQPGEQPWDNVGALYEDSTIVGSKGRKMTRQRTGYYPFPFRMLVTTDLSPENLEYVKGLSLFGN